MDKKLISICIPILNEQENIELIYKKITSIFDKLKDKDIPKLNIGSAFNNKDLYPESA